MYCRMIDNGAYAADPAKQLGHHGLPSHSAFWMEGYFFLRISREETPLRLLTEWETAPPPSEGTGPAVDQGRLEIVADC